MKHAPDLSLNVHRAALALRSASATAEATGCGQVVVVSSARAGEGKSFLAGLLARALAQQQDGEVLLVDAGLTLQPERSGGPGLASLLGGQQALASLLQPGSPPGLWHLRRGEAYHASQLFRSARLKDSLAAMRQRFPLTVVDAPELAASGALLTHADHCLLVVDASRTPAQAVRAALDAAQAVTRLPPERLLGVMLNRQPRGLPRWLGG